MHSARPRAILCEVGASTMALATAGEESTSPIPVMPASVWTFTKSVSWLPSARSLTSGRRRWMASTCVIFMVARCVLFQQILDRLALFLEFLERELELFLPERVEL